MENKVYLISDILRVLPHRYPFVMIDRLEVLEAGVKGIGFKNVTINEPFFQGHFPSNPIMPGVLQIEAMAQTAGMIIATANGELKPANVLFMGVDKVKFRRQVIPGDTLEIHAEKLKERRNVFVCAAKAYVGGALVCEAELTAMVV
ncbi:MAG: 3-hydroxyacyl-ACP dehydratase FabZ [Alphaproteobacteria bacterium]|nr:3-hydroxyacyl-ACP dehydratase FabZ [Alphaproteobacteria bacterium]